MAWQISGQYFETCSCDVLCPCILTNATAMPSRGHCDAVLAFRIDQGAFDGVDLAGLCAVVALQTDGPMADGRGRREVYVDSRAAGRQGPALETIFSGQAGGPLGALGALTPEYLGAVTAQIDFTLDGESRGVKVGGFGEQTVTGLPGPTETLHITNTMHPANSTLALARAGSVARFKDTNFDFDNAGQNGHYAPFAWQG